MKDKALFAAEGSVHTASIVFPRCRPRANLPRVLAIRSGTVSGNWLVNGELGPSSGAPFPLATKRPLIPVATWRPAYKSAGGVGTDAVPWFRP